MQTGWPFAARFGFVGQFVGGLAARLKPTGGRRRAQAGRADLIRGRAGRPTAAGGGRSRPRPKADHAKPRPSAPAAPMAAVDQGATPTAGPNSCPDGDFQLPPLDFLTQSRRRAAA